MYVGRSISDIPNSLHLLSIQSASHLKYDDSRWQMVFWFLCYDHCLFFRTDRYRLDNLRWGTLVLWLSRLMLDLGLFVNLQISLIFIWYLKKCQCKQPTRSKEIMRTTNDRTEKLRIFTIESGSGLWVSATQKFPAQIKVADSWHINIFQFHDVKRKKSHEKMGLK